MSGPSRSRRRTDKKPVETSSSSSSSSSISSSPQHKCRACKSSLQGCLYPGDCLFPCLHPVSKSKNGQSVQNICTKTDKCRLGSKHKQCIKVKNQATKAKRKRDQPDTTGQPVTVDGTPVVIMTAQEAAATQSSNTASTQSPLNLIAIPSTSSSPTTPTTTPTTTTTTTNAAATPPTHPQTDNNNHNGVVDNENNDAEAERTAHCVYCQAVVVISQLVLKKNGRKSKKLNGDIICKQCDTFVYCTAATNCLCNNNSQNSYCRLHPPSLHPVVGDDNVDFIIHSTCTFCRNKNNLHNRQSRHKKRISRTLLQPQQRLARKQLSIQVPTLRPPPTQLQTRLHEVSLSFLSTFYLYIQTYMKHTSNKNGKKGMFRKILKNKKNQLQWDLLAIRFKMFGTVGTLETGGEKIARMYHYLTLENTTKRIKRSFNKETGTINWSNVDSDVSIPLSF